MWHAFRDLPSLSSNNSTPHDSLSSSHASKNSSTTSPASSSSSSSSPSNIPEVYTLARLIKPPFFPSPSSSSSSSSSASPSFLWDIQACCSSQTLAKLPWSPITSPAPLSSFFAHPHFTRTQLHPLLLDFSHPTGSSKPHSTTTNKSTFSSTSTSLPLPPPPPPPTFSVTLDDSEDSSSWSSSSSMSANSIDDAIMPKRKKSKNTKSQSRSNPPSSSSSSSAFMSAKQKWKSDHFESNATASASSKFHSEESIQRSFSSEQFRSWSSSPLPSSTAFTQNHEELKFGNRPFQPPLVSGSKSTSPPSITSSSSKSSSSLTSSHRTFTSKSNEDLTKKIKNVEPKIVEMIENEILDTSSSIGWNDIAGLDHAKQVIQEIVIWPLKRPDLFTKQSLRRPCKGVLLFGPPGTGKTLIAKCIACQIQGPFFSISASSLTSKWMGDAEKLVKTLFTVARLKGPSVIFIDEIDSLLTARSEGENDSTRRLKTEFLVQFDGAATDSHENLLVIGATNRPQELDEAARRRFKKRLYIPLPCERGRRQLLTHLLSKQAHSLNEHELSLIIQQTEGYSGSDLTGLCEEAAMMAIRELDPLSFDQVQLDHIRPIQFHDFLKALHQIRPSVSPKDIEFHEQWNTLFGSQISPLVPSSLSGATLSTSSSSATSLLNDTSDVSTRQLEVNTNKEKL